MQCLKLLQPFHRDIHRPQSPTLAVDARVAMPIATPAGKQAHSRRRLEQALANALLMGRVKYFDTVYTQFLELLNLRHGATVLEVSSNAYSPYLPDQLSHRWNVRELLGNESRPTKS